ncbi:hypothetical protein [Catenulispora subtropica]|uniref:YokE-like PH domain-containing protein n=1 Tax=Catenulispora subtropica TaxID=450798 RepID=A0ABP5CXT8_9ACTN
MTRDPAGQPTGEYLGATADELGHTTPEEMAAAGVSQHAQFHRHGVISLTPDALVLAGWHGPGNPEPLLLRRPDILAVETRYTGLYGRFVGGILNAGKPLILSTRTVGQIYLLIDWKEFMETTHDRQWAAAIRDWLARGPAAEADGEGGEAADGR